MNKIIYNNVAMPVVCGCGMLAASEPFYHVDRIADFNVMIYVYDGTIFVSEENTDHEINKGGLIFLKHGLHCFGKREIPKGTRWFYVHFYFDESENADSFIGSTRQTFIYKSMKYLAPLPKQLDGLDGSETEERITQLCDYSTSEAPERDWYLNLKFAELLSFIALSGTEKAAVPTLSDKICAYLRRHTGKPFSSEELEKEFFLSYKRMAAVFKEEKGISMQKYHDKLKADEAQRLLSSTLMSVNEVAAAVGYSDALYFSRHFHDIVGFSPTEYRKSAAKIDFQK